MFNYYFVIIFLKKFKNFITDYLTNPGKLLIQIYLFTCKDVCYIIDSHYAMSRYKLIIVFKNKLNLIVLCLQYLYFYIGRLNFLTLIYISNFYVFLLLLNVIELKIENIPTKNKLFENCKIRPTLRKYLK